MMNQSSLKVIEGDAGVADAAVERRHDLLSVDVFSLQPSHSVQAQLGLLPARLILSSFEG